MLPQLTQFVTFSVRSSGTVAAKTLTRSSASASPASVLT